MLVVERLFRLIGDEAIVIFVAALSLRSCLAYEGAGAKQVY